MFPRFHRSLPPAASPASPARGAALPADGMAAAIGRVPRFAAAIGRPAKPEAPRDARGALCDTLTELVDTLAARRTDPRPPTVPRVEIRGDGPPPPAQAPHRRAPRPAVAGA